MSGANERFIVVGGSPRSGTSLLRTILTSHPALRVHATEPHYILELYRRYGTRVTNVTEAIDFLLAHDKFPRGEIDASALRNEFRTITTLSLSEFLRVCFRLLTRDTPGAPLVLKHPTFILHLDLVKSLFPNVIVMQSIRDPRANVLSQRTRWPSTSVWAAATRWKASVEAGRRWQARRATPYLEVRYEDLVTQPQTTCSALCDFLQIPFEPSMLLFDHVERQWDPASPGEGAKRHYHGFELQRIDKWKKFLTPLEVKLIEGRCRREMAWFKYVTADPQVALRTYVPYYLEERRKTLGKTVRRMKRRVSDAFRTR